MSLAERLTDQIRKMLGRPANERIDPMKGLELIARKVVDQHNITLSLLDERQEYRKAMVGLAFLCGQLGLEDIVLLEWPPESELADKPKPEPSRIVQIGKMVNLH